jgi:hypothetical protein
MRFRRFTVITAVVSVSFAAVAAVGCQTATQVTIDVKTTAACGDVHGTAITVGVAPEDTEERVEQKFVSAATTDCDAGAIGTLVVTPDDDMRGAAVVVVAYDTPRHPNHDPAECVPPLYEDCIVARRSFSFIEHTKLRMPITIEPDCLNVPCDALTTCHKGDCFSSEVPPPDDDGTIPEPGSLPDGGFDEAGVKDVAAPDAPGVTPVTDGAADAPLDAPADAPPDGPPDLGACGQTGTFTCNGQTCAPNQVCCEQGASAYGCTSFASCRPGAEKKCCRSSACNGGSCASATGGLEPGTCQPPPDGGSDAGKCPDAGLDGAVPAPGPVPMGNEIICNP